MTKDSLGYKLRFSDSSFYDEVCEHCGGKLYDTVREKGNYEMTRDEIQHS